MMEKEAVKASENLSWLNITLGIPENNRSIHSPELDPFRSAKRTGKYAVLNSSDIGANIKA